MWFDTSFEIRVTANRQQNKWEKWGVTGFDDFHLFKWIRALPLFCFLPIRKSCDTLKIEKVDKYSDVLMYLFLEDSLKIIINYWISYLLPKPPTSVMLVIEGIFYFQKFSKEFF